MFHQERIEFFLVHVKVSLPKPAILGKIHEKGGCDTRHGCHCRVIFDDRVFKFTLADGIVIIRADGQPERFVNGDKGFEGNQARHKESARAGGWQGLICEISWYGSLVIKCGRDVCHAVDFNIWRAVQFNDMFRAKRFQKRESFFQPGIDHQIIGLPQRFNQLRLVVEQNGLEKQGSPGIIITETTPEIDQRRLPVSIWFLRRGRRLLPPCVHRRKMRQENLQGIS